MSESSPQVVEKNVQNFRFADFTIFRFQKIVFTHIRTANSGFSTTLRVRDRLWKTPFFRQDRLVENRRVDFRGLWKTFFPLLDSFYKGSDFR